MCYIYKYIEIDTIFHLVFLLLLVIIVYRHLTSRILKLTNVSNWVARIQTLCFQIQKLYPFWYTLLPCVTVTSVLSSRMTKQRANGDCSFQFLKGIYYLKVFSQMSHYILFRKVFNSFWFILVSGMLQISLYS